MGSFSSMGSDVFRFTGNFFLEQVRRIRQQPLDWQAPALLFGGVLGLPIVPVALVGAYLHFVYEERFNQDLLFDLVARPAPIMRQVPNLAA